MSDFIEENNVTTKLAQDVQQELPTIYVSVKNLIACALGKNYEESFEAKIKPQNVMTCAKFLLQAIRSCPLPDIEQFCEEHPQPEDQLGVDRLDDICKYKVIHALRYKAEEKGGKITRLFGKSYIKWSKSWNLFRNTTVELLQQNTHIPLEEIEYFLKTYEASLDLEDKPEGVENNEKLIWATDFNGVLLEMQKERHQRVEGRQKDVPTEEEDPNSLEAQLFGAPSQPTVRGRNDSQATAVPSLNFNNNGEIVASRQSSMTSLNLNAYSGSPLQDSNLRTLDVRSRATTMEQLGLEPPLYEPLMRCISHDPAHVQDRERSTTLDLFAYEQQGYAASCPQSLVSSPKAGATRSYLYNAERRLNEHSSNDST
eukprot:gene17763-20235_t